jgi:integrase
MSGVRFCQQTGQLVEGRRDGLRHTKETLDSRVCIATPRAGASARERTKVMIAVRAVRDYVSNNALHPGDLLFPQRLLIPSSRSRAKRRPALTPERIAQLGAFTAANGLTYQHGTINGHRTGKCRCEWCLQASTEYSNARRAARRAPGVKTPRRLAKASSNITGHRGRREWGRVWKGAVKRAGIPLAPTAYQLRHTHASWLIEAGQDPKTVMKRLGHHNLATFSLYAHVVEETDDVVDTMSALLEGMG